MIHYGEAISQGVGCQDQEAGLGYDAVGSSADVRRQNGKPGGLGFQENRGRRFREA
jgi:hypothetical protein